MRSKLWLVCLFALVGMASNASAEDFKVFRDGAWATYTVLDDAIIEFNAHTTATLQLPAGTFHFNYQIQPRAYSSIIGTQPQATKLVACPSLDETTLVKLQGNNVTIQDVCLTRLTDTRSAVTGDGIDLGYANAPDGVRRGVFIRRVGVLRNNVGITAKNANGSLIVCSDIILECSSVFQTKSYGVNLLGADITMDSVKTHWTGASGANLTMLRQASDQIFQSVIRVENCTFQGAVENGLNLTGYVMGYATEGDKMIVTGNLFDSIGTTCIDLDNTCQVEISNNMIRGTGRDIDPPADGSFSGTWTCTVNQYSTGGIGINVQSSNNNVIIDANTLNSHQVAIQLVNSISDPNYSETGPNNVVVSNNIIYRGDWVTGSPIGVSIWNDEQQPALIENVTVTDNNIRDMYLGIMQSGNTDGLVIVGNMTINCSYDVYTWYPTNYVIDHNLAK